MSDEKQIEAEALDCVNRAMRRRGGRQTAAASIRLQSPSLNHRAAQRLPLDQITEKQVAYLRDLRPEMTEAAIRALTRGQAQYLIALAFDAKAAPWR